MISTMGVTVYLHFSYVSYKNKGIFENKKMLLIYLVPLFFIAFYIINPEHIVIESNDSDLGLYDVQSIGLYSFFKPVFFGSVGIMITLVTYNFIMMFRSAKSHLRKQRALYFVFSALVPLVGFVISITLIEIFHIIPRFQLRMVALSISGAIIVYGILRHRLFDIEFIVKKTFVYLLVTLALIGIFRLIELILSHFISATFFGGDITARLIAAAIVAGFFFPLRSFGIKIGDRLLPKLTKTVKYEYSKELAVYKKQLEHALEDGELSEKEVRMLKSLRADLGISDKEHDRLKREIVGKP
jgi:hypothetical protein